MKGFWKDFKVFISKGRIVDLAIAVAVGGSFGKIVTSLVNDVIMPLISFSTGGVSIKDWKWVITPANEALGIAESSLNYGLFLQTILDFFIITFFVFLAITIVKKSKIRLEKFKSKKDKDENMEMSPEEIGKNPLVQEGKEIVTAEKSEANKNEIILAMAKMTEETQKINKSQEKILREIRDLLKKK